MDSNDPKLHIAMFPWLAFGYMIPYLELAKLIAQKGHQIFFISTPRNIERLPQLPPNLSSLITFVKLPLPRVDDDFPEAAEATTDLPQNKVMKLKNAYDALQQPLTHFLESSNPDWLLFDFAAYWAPTTARNLGIPCAFFSIFIGACLVFLGPTSPEISPDYRKNPEDYTVPPKWVPFPSNVAFRLFEVGKVYIDSITGDESNVSDVYRNMEGMRGCDIIAIRDIHRKQVLLVGQLPTTNYEENDRWGSMSQWLDRKPKASVVYVAFGSEAMPSQEEITRIA
ncbi:PREDICTED: UDP-glycosyltransferase [Prunus dulcis]|uniref:PREDICTED: UDP-glycosyltransferase n=1 Tax=Prunus dulcis TaxID=3755 RepID=A0A5E4EZ85_PRUDU|nr:PREDICTED: UDP-glycosyltransferase [Prunus dulcis]